MLKYGYKNKYTHTHTHSSRAFLSSSFMWYTPHFTVVVIVVVIIRGVNKKKWPQVSQLHPLLIRVIIISKMLVATKFYYQTQPADHISLPLPQQVAQVSGLRSAIGSSCTHNRYILLTMTMFDLSIQVTGFLSYRIGSSCLFHTSITTTAFHIATFYAMTSRCFKRIASVCLHGAGRSVQVTVGFTEGFTTRR